MLGQTRLDVGSRARWCVMSRPGISHAATYSIELRSAFHARDEGVHGLPSCQTVVNCVGPGTIPSPPAAWLLLVYTGQLTGVKGIHTCTQHAARRWCSHLVWSPWWTRMTEQQEAVHQQQQKHNRKRNRNTTGYVPRTQRPRMASSTNSETKSHEIIPTPRAVPTPSNVPNHAYQRGRY